VRGYWGRYSVSNQGRVRSHLPRNRNSPPPNEPRPMKLTVDDAGYRSVMLRDWNGGARRHRVHVLVAQAFHENLGGYRVVRHLDGDKLNNNVMNLAWGTHADNSADAARHGDQARGQQMPHAVLTEGAVLRAALLRAKGYTWRQVSEALGGVNVSTIRSAVTGRSWKYVL
jgi:hypothetical protein